METGALVTLAAVIVTLPVALKSPFVGLLIYLSIGFLRPQDWFEGLDTYRPMFLIAIATLCGLVLRTRGLFSQRLRELDPIFALICVLCLSTLYATDPISAVDGLVAVAKTGLIVWAIVHLVDSKARFDFAIWAIAISGGVIGMAGTFQGLSGSGRIVGPGGAEGGLFGGTNAVARLMIMILPLYYYLWTRQRATVFKIVAAIGFATSVTATIFTYSRGGLLALVLVVTLLGLSRRPRWISMAFLGAGITVMLAIVPRDYTERMQTIVDFHQDASAMGRVDAWRASMRMADVHPVLGIGVNNFVGQYPAYSSRPKPVRSSHNVFLEVLAESGILGLLLYVIVFGSQLWHSPRTQQVAMGADEEWRTAADDMLRIGLWGFLATGLFQGGPYFEPAFILLGLLVAHRRNARTRATDIHPIVSDVHSRLIASSSDGN